MTMRSYAVTAIKGVVALSLLALSLLGVAADAAEIKVICSPGIRAVMAEFGPRFEQATGHKLSIRYGMGPQARQQIEAGEDFDVALVSFDIGDLIQQGRLAAGTRVVLGRSGIGVAVRKGAPKPDIGTVDAFRRAMLDAKSVSYSGGSPGAHILGLFERLGIAQAMKPKLVSTATLSLSDAIAKGEPEIAVNGIAPILNAPGAELVGWLPPELQSYVVFVGAIGAASKATEAGQALVRFLTTPEAVAALGKIGVEPAAP